MAYVQGFRGHVVTDGDASDGPPQGPDQVRQECTSCRTVRPQTVLRAAESGWTLQCMVCQSVRTVPAPPLVRTRIVSAIVSDGAASRKLNLDLPMDGRVAVDDEFDVEGHRIRVTAVESNEGTRPTRLAVPTLRTIYAVHFDTVALHYTVNQGETTRSFREDVAPEEEVHVGSVREVQGVRLAVKTLKSDQNRTLHRGFLLARNVRRVFADLAPTGRRTGDRVRTRRRGAGPSGASRGRKAAGPRGGPRRSGPPRSRPMR